MAASAISLLFSGELREGLWNLRNYLLIAAVYLVAAAGRDRTTFRRMFFILLVSACASALYGISIFLLGRGDGTLGRTSGSFSNAMTFGGVMLLLCSLMLAIATARGVRSARGNDRVHSMAQRPWSLPAVGRTPSAGSSGILQLRRTSWRVKCDARLRAVALSAWRYLGLLVWPRTTEPRAAAARDCALPQSTRRPRHLGTRPSSRAGSSRPSFLLSIFAGDSRRVREARARRLRVFRWLGSRAHNR